MLLYNQFTNRKKKNSSYYNGFIFPYVMILLLLTAFFLSYFSNRYVLKLKTMEHLEQYYYREIIKEIESRQK